MMKMKRFLALGAAALVLGSSMPVGAATLKDVFDAEYYADKYEDLKEAFGYDEAALYKHYITYGVIEGRDCTPVINVAAYRATYEDLDAAFGDNWDAYVNHYFTYGIYENRNNCADLAIIPYVNAYSDLQNAFGEDYLAIAQHYLQYGMDENRTAGSKAEIARVQAAAAAAAKAESTSSDCSESTSSDCSESTTGATTVTEVTEWGTYVYEVSGDVYTTCTVYDTDGNFVMKTVYTYDEAGEIIKYSWYDESGAYTGCQEVIFYEDGSVTYVTYDADGQETDILNIDADGNITYG